MGTILFYLVSAGVASDHPPRAADSRVGAPLILQQIAADLGKHQ